MPARRLGKWKRLLIFQLQNFRGERPKIICRSRNIYSPMVQTEKFGVIPPKDPDNRSRSTPESSFGDGSLVTSHILTHAHMHTHTALPDINWKLSLPKSMYMDWADNKTTSIFLLQRLHIQWPSLCDNVTSLFGRFIRCRSGILDLTDHAFRQANWRKAS